MVKRVELLSKIKEKILLVGDSGAGKTFTCVKTAEYVAGKGKKVVYIDTEYGAERELELLDDQVLENIEVKICPDWEEMKEAILDESPCFLKIVDGLSEVFLSSRRFVQEKFIRSGSYIVGEKVIQIKDRDIFTLPWQGYPIVYDSVRMAVDKLVKQPCHIVCTMHELGASESKEKLQEDIYRKFDTVVELFLEKDPVSGNVCYSSIVRKHRGRPFTGPYRLSDHVSQIVNLFKKRLEEVEVKKVG